jgi:hypothetical protein
MTTAASIQTDDLAGKRAPVAARRKLSSCARAT